MRGIYISVQLFPTHAPYSNDSRLSNAFPNSLRHNVQYHVTARKDTPVQKINLYSVTQYFYRLLATYREWSTHAPGLDCAASVNAISTV